MKVEGLWNQLNTERWPLSIKDLPSGTALVGGAVRDGLLNRLKGCPDLDLVVPSQAIQLAKELAINLKGTCVVLDPKRDIARLIVKGWTIDFAARTGTNLQEDLSQRDFTINAIALSLTGAPRLFDPTNGINDLKKGRLVAIQEQNLIADPLRLLRGLRLVAEMNLLINEETKQWIKKHHKLLPKAAPERIQTEINKLVRAPWADTALLLAIDFGLLKFWGNPKGPNSEPPFLKKTTVMSNEERSIAMPLARLTYLFSDHGLETLRFSRKERKRCQLLRHWKNLNDGDGFNCLSETDRLQLHQDLEEDLPALIIELSLSQQIDWLERWRNSNDPLFHPSSPIDGHTLQTNLKLPSGKIVGMLINHLSIEKAFGRISSRNEAINAASYWLEQNKSLL